MTWNPVSRREQLAWEQRKGHPPLRRKAMKRLGKLRDQICRTPDDQGMRARYQLAAGLCVEGRYDEAMALLTGSKFAAQPRVSPERGKVIKFPGAE